MIIVPSNIPHVSGGWVYDTTITIPSADYFSSCALYGNKLYVSDNSNPTRVWVINTSTNTYTTAITTTHSQQGSDLKVAGSYIVGCTLYANDSDYNNGGVWAIDPDTDSIAWEDYLMRPYMGRMIISDDGNNAWQWGNSEIQQFRSNGTFGSSPSVGISVGSDGDWVNGNRIFFPMGNLGMYIYDASTMSETYTIPSPGADYQNHFAQDGMLVDNDRNLAFIPSGYGEYIYVVNTQSNYVQESFSLATLFGAGCHFATAQACYYHKATETAYWTAYGVYSSNWQSKVSDFGLYAFNTVSNTLTVHPFGPEMKDEFGNPKQIRAFVISDDGEKAYFPMYDDTNRIVLYKLV